MKSTISKLVNKHLVGLDRHNANQYLKKADMALQNQNIREIISKLEDLYGDLDDTQLDPEYKRLVKKVIEDYNLKVRKMDSYLNTEYSMAFDDYTPMTFGRFLKNLGGTLREDGNMVIPPILLDENMKVYKDDGMGYCPEEPSDVFEGYKSEDGIQIWV